MRIPPENRQSERYYARIEAKRARKLALMKKRGIKIKYIPMSEKQIAKYERLLSYPPKRQGAIL